MTSGITFDELRKWGGDEIFNQAMAIVNSGDVLSVVYDDEALTVSGEIAQPGGYAMKVAFKLKAQERIESLCPCMRNQRYGMICEHVVALGIALAVREMPDEDAPPTADDEGAVASEEHFIEVEMVPKFYGYLAGSRASLSIELDAWYGEIELPVCSPQAERVVYLEDPDDPLVRRVRSLERERAAVKRIEKFGFTRGYGTGESSSLKLFLTDPQKVLTFLGTGLPALRRLGWRIDLSEKLYALAESFDYAVPVVTITDAGEDFTVRYTFETAHGTVSAPAIQAAINRGDGTILDGGAVTLVDLAAVEALEDVFRDVAAAGSGARDGSFRVKGVHAPYVKAALDALGSVEVDDNAAQHWRETAASRNRDTLATFEKVDLGPLEATLRPYQKEGVYWMWFLERAALSGLLADEMGLGKTLQTLAYLSLPRAGGRARAKPSLIVCPTSLVRNWEAEARKFTPFLKTLVVSGPTRSRTFPAIDAADLVITSYALLQRDFDAAYAERTFAAVVLDEAQHIKNRRTRNAIAAKGIRAERRLVLTGTPVENSVADVWSIFDFLMPGYLGDYESFKLGYEDPIAAGGDAAESAQAKLRLKLHPFILRRLKKMVAQDLPDKLVKVSYCPLDEELEREYVTTLTKERRGAKTKFQMLALLMKLRQIASRGKVDAFMEQLAEATDGGHRVLVFSQFVKQLHVLSEELDKAGIKYCYLDGSTKDRLGEVERFNRDRSIPVFLISLMAGGTGLNLTGADTVIHYDPWWNPAVEDQATDRAHRIGQTKRVYVIKLIASDTVEEKVLALQRRKAAVIAATVATSDAAIVEKLSYEDLEELLKS